MPTLIISIQYNVRVPSQWIKQGRKKKNPQYSIEKEDATLFLFSGDIIVIMEKILKNPIEILLELWNKFNKAMW